MRKRFIKYGLICLVIVLMYLLYLTTTISFENRFAHVLYAENKIINAQVSEDQQWRIQCTELLPEKLEITLKLFEDQYFNYHPGINPISLITAMKDNIKAGRVVRGGSTLTMQLARIHEKNQPRTYGQKCKEVLLAFALELKYSKKEIINLYAQHAPYGGNTVGYCAAAQRYYNKDAIDLTWSEAATLSVLPNAPSKIYPGKGQEVLIRKRNFLLEKLLAKKLIDSISFRLSVLESLPQQSNTFESLSPHLLQLYKTKKKSYHLATTLDYSLQKNVMNVIQNHQSQNSIKEGIENISALILRNNGSIAAYVGNADCGSNCSKDVDVLQSVRSPGSTLKPFLFGLAMDNGLITSQSLLEDIPIFYNGYAPANFDKKFRGIVTAENALTRSLNIPAVNLLREYGMVSFLHDLAGMGFSFIDKSADHYGLSIILGGAEVNPLNLGKAYLNLVRTAQGKKALENLMLLTSDEQIFTDYPISQFSSFLILDMLKGVNRPENQNGWEFFSSKKDISWKTGTSFGFRDAWSVGCTEDYTVLVWVGNADGEGKPTLTGMKKAAPVLFDLFELLPNADAIAFPQGALITKTLCKQSGYLASEACTHTIEAPLTKTLNKLKSCTYHTWMQLDESGTHQVYEHCVENSIHRKVFGLNPIVNNCYKKHSGKSFALPTFMPGCADQKSSLEIVYPTNNAEILLPTDIDLVKQTMVSKAIVSQEVDSLYWFLDNELFEITVSDHKVEMNVNPGDHVLTLVTSTGNEKSHEFKILE